MKHTKSPASAFTIVELLIVVVVIAILAAITIVSYNGITSQAKDSAIKASLSQAKTKLEIYKVKHGVYPATGDLSVADLQDDATAGYSYVSADGTNYCLVATNAALTYRVTGTTDVAQGGCADTDWLGNITLVNIVNNGDFSQGLAGWSVIANRATVELVDGYGQFVGNGSHENYEVWLPGTLQSVTGHIYYSRLDTRVLNALPSYTMLYFGDADTYMTGERLVQNVWFNRSSRWTASVDNSTRYVRFSFSTAANQAGKVANLNNVVLIDLTESFGAGNEPSKEQMDAMLQQFPDSYFAGTVGAGN